MDQQTVGKHKHIIYILATVLSIVALTGCHDDKFDTPTFSDEEAEGIDISFIVGLGQEGGTRATYKEGSVDNYIDPSTVQVLFLDKNGNFLFQPSSFEMTPTPDNNGQWYLTVHLNNTITGEGEASILSNIKSQLEKEPFKIALLANWREKEESEAYKLNWGWSNSSINPSVSAENKKTINDLHHLVYDDYYANRNKAYKFIMDGDSKMGLNSEWVRMRDITGKEMNGNDAWHAGKNPEGNFSNTESANAWIKKNWDPSKDNLDATVRDHKIYRHYRRLWQLWNFGGSFTGNEITYSKLGATKFEEEWKARNGDKFAVSVAESPDDYWCYYNNHRIKNGQSNDGLTVVSTQNKITGKDNEYVRSYKGTNESGAFSGYCGLVLPEMTHSTNALEDYHPENPSKHKPWIKTSSSEAVEYIKFEAPGTGTLRLLFSSYDENPVSIVVQRGANWEMTFKTEGRDIKEIGKKDSNSTNLGLTYPLYDSKSGYQIKLTSGPEPIIIYSLEGSAIIYAIEFVCDDYLAGTDREGIMPTTNYPIPMYGVQEFPKIENWGSQKVLNISQTGKFISLIRSLAKVELYLPVGKEYSHIYLRSMNRKARCEPMDVESSTGDLWKLHEDGETNCEWFRIQSYGSGYKESNFESWYGWFYGSWSSWGWSSLKEKAWEIEPPHLFNPDVQRSDFCHFIKDNEYNDGLYHRYFLYVPDKGISDPNSENDLTSSPKVCHIEYRDSEMSEYLDDNNCYRIYFTDYTSNTAIRTVAKDKFENGYENNAENLKQHWPIMRNHIYRFYVGAGNTPQEIRVKVSEWGETAPKKEVW